MAEVQEHGGHRAQLDDGGEGGARVLPAGEGGDDAQVRRARDRQELGEPLDDAEDDRLERAHRARPAQVHGHRRAGERAPVRAEQEGHDAGDLLGLDQPLDGVRGEDDLLEHLLLGDAVRLRLVGDLLLDQRRADEAGADRAGEDAVLGALERERPHQAEHAVLGRHVAGLVGRGGERVGGGDRDEAPVAAPDQVLPGVAGEQERAREQQRDQPVPAVLGELGDRRDVLEAGVGDDRVEAAERARAPRRPRRDCPRAWSGRRRTGTPGPSSAGFEVDGQHVAAVGAQSVGDRTADPSGRSR